MIEPSLDLIRRVRQNMRPMEWASYKIDPNFLKNILNGSVKLPDYMLRNASQDKNDIGILMTILPVSQNQLPLFGANVPESWAERVPLGQVQMHPNIIDKAIENHVPLDIIYILMLRGALPSMKSIVDLLLRYPISIRRDKIYYTALGLSEIPEVELLQKYIPGDNTGVLSRRLHRLKELFFQDGVCNPDKKFKNEGCSNDTTFLASIDEVPPVYIYKYKTGITQTNTSGTTYCFNLLEMAPEIFKARNTGSLFKNPYTREIIPPTVVNTMANTLMNLGTQGYPLYLLSPQEACSIPQVSIPKLKERLETLIKSKNLGAYINDINDITRKYGAETTLSLRNYPNIIRNYDNDLVPVILQLYPIEDIIKKII